MSKSKRGYGGATHRVRVGIGKMVMASDDFRLARHVNHAQAVAEAERLAKKHPGVPFMVLSPTKIVKMPHEPGHGPHGPELDRLTGFQEWWDKNAPEQREDSGAQLMAYEWCKKAWIAARSRVRLGPGGGTVDTRDLESRAARREGSIPSSATPEGGPAIIEAQVGPVRVERLLCPQGEWAFFVGEKLVAQAWLGYDAIENDYWYLRFEALPQTIHGLPNRKAVMEAVSRHVEETGVVPG